MPKYVMLIQAEKCLNCQACVLACQQRNAVPYGMGRNWVRAIDTPSGPKFQPGACMHCDNPLCVSACPTGATYKAADNRVLIDEPRCIACGACVTACPYKARYIHPQRHVVDKCNYCTTSLSMQGEPACVSVCPTRVRVFGDTEDPGSAVAQLLKNASTKLVAVEPENQSLRPTLRYVGKVHDPHWPQVQHNNASAVMGGIATGLRWLGGLSLFGVLAMLVKDFCVSNPEDKAPKSDETPKSEREDS